MTEQTSQRGRKGLLDTRERIIAAALACLASDGRAGTSIAAVSRSSGVSRPTIYAHFRTLDQLVHEAIESAAVDLSMRIGRETSKAATPGAALVEFVVHAHHAFRADPVVQYLIELTHNADHDGSGQFTSSTFQLTGRSLRRLIPEGDPALDRLDEISETFNRFLMSILTYSSERTSTDERLRDYLTRVMLPALGVR